MLSPMADPDRETALTGAESSPTLIAGTWGERRDRLVTELGGAAMEALAATREALADRRMRDARDGAVTFGVLVDKCKLFADEAEAAAQRRPVNPVEDAKAVLDRIVALRDRARVSATASGDAMVELAEMPGPPPSSPSAILEPTERPTAEDRTPPPSRAIAVGEARSSRPAGEHRERQDQAGREVFGLRL
jgi:hypothetical protein